MRDDVSLRVGGVELRNFLGYSVTGNLFEAADRWTLQLARPEVKIARGARCELFVNGRQELAGLIDLRNPGYTKKEGRTLRLGGRDFLGLVVDTHCEEFRTLRNVTLKSLAEYLLYGKKIDKSSTWPGIPFLDRQKISVPEGVKGGLKKQKKGKKDPIAAIMGASTALKYSQIEPGMTVFQVLSQYAVARGLLFWAEPDGTMVFGVPTSQGDPVFTFTNRLDGRGNNVLDGSLVDDDSKRFSRITVIGQQQGQSEFGLQADKINIRGTVVDDTFPFRKPYVARSNNDAQTPAMQARLIREKMRRDAFRVTYTVKGHSQNGINYTYNRVCKIYDEDLELDGSYLVYGRTFELDRKVGRVTRVEIGPLPEAI
jgi:prophage tail gpP-like protein